MKFPPRIERLQRTTHILPGTAAQKVAEAFKLVVLAAHPNAKVSWDPSPYGLTFRIEGVKLAPGRLCVWAVTPEVASLVHIHPGVGETTFNRLSDFARRLKLPYPIPGVGDVQSQAGA